MIFMFCIECGSENKQMIGEICIDCFLKDFKMIEIPKKIDVEICSHCNSRLEEGKWSESYLPEEEIIYRALERNIKINDLVENEDINLEIDQVKGTIAECFVEVVGEVYGVSIEETHDTQVRILKTVCPPCSKIQSGYYETVVQFRADNREIKAEEYKKADEIVARTLDKQSKVDKEFGGVIKESPRLISEDKSTGKGLYRIWISVRIPEFENEDIIEFEDKVIKVTDIDKNRVVGIDIKTNKKQNIPLKNMDNIKLIKKANDIETTTIISISPKIIQILDPSDYSAVDLEMQEEFSDYNIGDEIKLIKIENYIYLIK